MSEVTSKLVTYAFDALKKCEIKYELGGAGNNPADYARSVDLSAKHLDDAKIDREDVLAICRCSVVPIEEKVVAILAWGGMHRGSFNTFYRLKSNWEPVCKDIADKKLSRKAAFRRFSELQSLGKIKGMGPAYYTKLIYFLMAETNDRPAGYIMDQWAACSVNLLFDPAIVKMDSSYVWKNDGGQRSSFLVSPLNSSDVYEAFCQAMDELRSMLKMTRHELDALLISKGGKSPEPWRRFVIENRKSTFNGKSTS